MKYIVDARGFSCPEPVIMTKKAIEKDSPSRLEVVVDTHVACENISRFAMGLGYKAEVKEENEDYRIVLVK